MKKTIFSKIFFGYLIGAIILSGLITAISFSAVRSHYISTLGTNLENEAKVISSAVMPYLEPLNSRGMDNFVKRAAAGISTRITVVGADGTVLADSEADTPVMDNHANRPEIMEAMRGTPGRSTRYSNTFGERLLYYAMPIQGKGGGVTAVVRASLHLNRVDDLMRTLLEKVLLITICVIILSLIAAYAMSRHIYAPIAELHSASKAVAGRNFDVRVDLREKDELWEFAESFNFMTEEIKNLFAEKMAKQAQMDTVISSITEGLLVVDEKGRILIVNNSFKKLAGAEISEGMFYWESFLPVKFNQNVEQCLKKGINSAEQIEINNRVFLCSSTFMAERKQAAFILHDITEFNDLERIKKDFVANVSHELRTPLTAIKGFAETLEIDNRDADARHYLDVIKRHTERLINIVNDLLTLSQLEQMEVIKDAESAAVEDAVTNAAKIFEESAAKKGLYIRLEIEKGLPKIKGDSFRLEQVFINLIDNAIKYTENGGVDVRVAHEDGWVSVRVADTGTGIPEESLPRIFERFYVVDKSRSRKLGGTGLGLSIVKHIVGLHAGTLAVESKPGTGTVFTVRFPAIHS
ncbi:MAG: hypothetical protein LLG37_09270 [Spirochaetia bacterium]|nr:hypothetical protein [Spirochaetia bacterium]